jgi:RNA polymerase sigma-70 factor (ECF subfamily)
MNKENENILVEKAKAGNRKAYAELVKRYENIIYNLAYRISGNYDDASDIMQDTFAQALRKLDTFKGQSKFATWLYRIAVNMALMKKRKDKRSRLLSLEDSIYTKDGIEFRRQLRYDWSQTPIEILESKEVLDTLNDAINKLPEKYRTVLVLSDVNGLPNKEVSEILHISGSAVKSRLHRARLYLRDNLTLYFRNSGTLHDGS